MTQQVKRISELSREYDGFYVPAFEVHVEDKKVPDSIVGDVLSVSYRDQVDGIDTFNLTVNNWDTEHNTFKYIGAPDETDNPFQLGKRITLKMGYQGKLETMLSGDITGLDASFPQSGSPTLSVRGENELRRFRASPHTHRFEDLKRDSEIAQWLGQQPKDEQRPGLGMRVEAPNADNEPFELIQMVNEPDIMFLLRRAHVRGYVLSLRRRAGEDPFLYFGPPEHARLGAADGATAQEQVYELAWGSGLHSFNPMLDASKLVESVTFSGVARDAGEPVSWTARTRDLDGRTNVDQTDVERVAAGRREFAHVNLRSTEEARTRAESALRENHRDLIRGSGMTFGLPRLRAGMHVRLMNLGARFTGNYLVLDTTHTIGGGYQTLFTARREEPIDVPAVGAPKRSTGVGEAEPVEAAP